MWIDAPVKELREESQRLSQTAWSVSSEDELVMVPLQEREWELLQGELRMSRF